MSRIDHEPDDLERRLIELGHRIDGPEPPPDLAERVLAGLPDGLRRRRRTRRRFAVAVAIALAIALALTPPVRAAVTDLLRMGGVLIKTGGPVVTPTTAPPATAGGRPHGQIVSVAEARRAVDFALVVPADLGEPDQIAVSDDRRVVSMRWGTGSSAVVWDQMDGRLSPVFLKQAGTVVEPVHVHGRDAFWIPDPHPLIYLDEDGTEHTAEARISGPSLVYVRGPVTVRLEGVQAQRNAIRIAESAD